MSEPAKQGEKQGANTPKVLSLRQGGRNSPLSLKERPVRVRSLKDAKKLLARLLVGFQRGEIQGEDARTLCHIISTYIQLVKDLDLEARIVELEERVKEVKR